MKQIVKRNILTFEAPNILAEKAKKLAEENMVSTGAICRQALNQYISAVDMQKQAEEHPTY